MITAELVNIGRNNVCKTITVKDIDSVYNEVRKHLMSSDVEMVAEDDDGLKWNVFAGFRTVGEVFMKCGCGNRATVCEKEVYKCETCKNLS